MGGRPPKKRGGAPVSRRVGEDVRMRLAQIMQRELRDPRTSGVHLTRVEMSADLSHAQVHFRTTPGAASVEEATGALRGAAGFLRRELGRTLRLKAIPELHFHHDELVDEGDRVDALLAGLAAGRPGPPPAASDDEE